MLSHKSYHYCGSKYTLELIKFAVIFTGFPINLPAHSMTTQYMYVYVPTTELLSYLPFYKFCHIRGVIFIKPNSSASFGTLCRKPICTQRGKQSHWMRNFCKRQRMHARTSKSCFALVMLVSIRSKQFMCEITWKLHQTTQRRKLFARTAVSGWFYYCFHSN